MFHKMLGEASDDLDRVTSQSREDLPCRKHTEYTSMFSCQDSERSVFVLVPRQSVLRVDRWSMLQMAMFAGSSSCLCFCTDLESGVRVQDVSANFDDI